MGIERLGRYELERPLGAPGDRTYLARAVGIDGFARHVVARIVDRDAIGKAEARRVGLLHHQHIAPVLEIGRDGEHTFVVTEYVHGRTVQEIWRQISAMNALLPVDFVLTVVGAAATALHHAHGQITPIVHGRVSGASVVVGFDGAVKVGGFPLGPASQTAATVSAIGASGMDIGYLAPEQARQQPIDARTDVFALGVLLYELTTTRRAFRDASDRLTIERIKSGAYARPRTIVEDYPAELEAIVARALQVVPAERYQTTRELRRDLEAVGHRLQLVLGDTAVIEVMEQLFEDRDEPWLRAPAAASTAVVGPDLDGPADRASRRKLRAATEAVDAYHIVAEVPAEIEAAVDAAVAGAMRPDTDLGDMAATVVTTSQEDDLDVRTTLSTRSLEDSRATQPARRLDDTKTTSEGRALRDDDDATAARTRDPRSVTAVPAPGDGSEPRASPAGAVTPRASSPGKATLPGVVADVRSSRPRASVGVDTDGIEIAPAPAKAAAREAMPTKASSRVPLYVGGGVLALGLAIAAVFIAVGGAKKKPTRDANTIAVTIDAADAAATATDAAATVPGTPDDAAAATATPPDAAATIDTSPTVTVAVDAALAATVKIKVTSTPPGAGVELDSKKLGRTPYEGVVEVTTAGPHTLKLRMPGYATARIPVDVSADIVEDVVLKKARPEPEAGSAARPGSDSQLQLPD